MSAIRLGVSPRLRTAVAKQTAAAEARDPAALRDASRAVVAAGWTPLPAVYGASLTDRVIGSLLLSGEAGRAASSLRNAARRFGADGEVALARIDESNWNATELTLLRELRLLARDWRPLPGMPRRRDLRMLGSGQRRELRQAHALCVAFAERDPIKAQRAIAAVGRNDPAKFSVLAYALYREADRAGLKLRVPRKYAF